MRCPLPALLATTLLLTAVPCSAAVRLYTTLEAGQMVVVPQASTPLGLDVTWRVDTFSATLSDGRNSTVGQSSAILSTGDYSMSGTANLERLAVSIQGQPARDVHPSAITHSTLTVTGQGSGTAHISIPYDWILLRDEPAEQVYADFFAINDWFVLDSHHAQLPPGTLEGRGSGWLEFDVPLSPRAASYSVELVNAGGAFVSTVPEPPQAAVLALCSLLVAMSRRRQPKSG